MTTTPAWTASSSSRPQCCSQIKSVLECLLSRVLGASVYKQGVLVSHEHERDVCWAGDLRDRAERQP